MKQGAPERGATSIEVLKYPVLLFSEDYFYLAERPIELRIWRRRSLRRIENESVAVVDSAGARYRVSSWRPIGFPQHWRALVGAVLLCIFAEPNLAYERAVSAADFAKEVENMIVRYGIHGGLYGAETGRFRADWSQIGTFDALFRFLRRLS